MDAVLNLIAQYKLIAGGGALSILATVICIFLKKMEWLTIWNKMYPLGGLFDKLLTMKMKWLEQLFEDIGVLGVIPAVVAFLAGMTGNNDDLRIKMKKILLEMAAKL